MTTTKYCFFTKQKGYGRKGLYFKANEKEIHLMDVFPNVEEHFDIVYYEDAFYDEDSKFYFDANGRRIEENHLYEDIDEWLSNHLAYQIAEALEEEV